jgi:hypothetical protein
MNRFAAHGPVRVAAPDRLHLAHADGTPFFYLADTAWNGALLSTDADWATYLDDRVARGFTAIQLITHAPWTAALANAEGLTAFEGDDPARVRPEFFDRIDRRIAEVNARGMLAVPVLAWAANFGASARLNVGHTASAEQLIPLLRYQVERLGRHHVMWVLAGDGVYNFWRRRKWRTVGRAVFGDRADRAPVALHTAGLTWPYDALADQSWLDVYGYQTSHSEDPSALRWLQQGPQAETWRRSPRPTINLEPVYEGIGPAPGYDRAAVRRAVYWSLLNAPTAGVAYGAHGLWGWHERAAEALNHPGMGVGRPWHEAMRLPGSADVGRAGEAFGSVEWWRLRPDPGMVGNQAADRARYVAASRSAEGDVVAVYLPAGGEVSLRLAEGLELTWFDPRTGSRTLADRLVAPTEGEDWLLLGRRAGGH